MTIKELKKELGLNNSKIAEFFGLTTETYANSSAKKRYELSLIKFYTFIKSKNSISIILVGFLKNML